MQDYYLFIIGNSWSAEHQGSMVYSTTVPAIINWLRRPWRRISFPFNALIFRKGDLSSWRRPATQGCGLTLRPTAANPKTVVLVRYILGRSVQSPSSGRAHCRAGREGASNPSLHCTTSRKQFYKKCALTPWTIFHIPLSWFALFRPQIQQKQSTLVKGAMKIAENEVSQAFPKSCWFDWQSSVTTK